MNENYKRLEKMIEKLQDTRKVRLAKSDFRYYSESVNKSLLKDLQTLTIAPSILQHYEQLDFIHIRWYISENAIIEYIDKELDFVGGGVNIRSFSALMQNIKSGQSQSIIDPYKTLRKQDYDALVHFIPFDILDGNGAVCLKNENGAVFDILYLISIGQESFIKQINCNVDTYLNKGLENYFFYNWQKAVFLDDQQSKAQMDFYLNQLGF